MFGRGSIGLGARQAANAASKTRTATFRGALRGTRLAEYIAGTHYRCGRDAVGLTRVRAQELKRCICVPYSAHTLWREGEDWAGHRFMLEAKPWSLSQDGSLAEGTVERDRLRARGLPEAGT